MINIGRFNKLAVDHIVDFGAYLDAGDGNTILLPAKYFGDKVPEVGEVLDVFVYTDSEDRLIATTERPYAIAGEFAFLQVRQVNKFGAFLDWGVEGKDLLVPFSEQRANMAEGGIYLVYVYLDHSSQRLAASQKIEKFLGNVLPRYKRGDEVKALVYQHTPIGYKCIVDDLHYGMVYTNELFRPLELEQTITAYVKQVREDGKIDLTVSDRARARTGNLADNILKELEANDGKLPLCDKSSPEEIQAAFQCSKKDFKKAIGKLYKDHRIALVEGGIELAR